MRPTTLLLVLLLAVVAGGCGSGSGSGSGSDAAPAGGPDQSVQAPAQQDDTVKAVDPAVCKRLSRRLAGRTLDDAQGMARRTGCALRIVSQDGQGLPVTDDFSRARINVRVEAGTVREVTGLF